MNKQELQQKIDEAKTNIELWTKELEKLERDRRLAETELLDMCDGVQSEPYKTKLMWFINFDVIGDEAEIDWDETSVQNPYIFATKESAQKAVDTLGREKLKLIFRVE